MTDNRVFEINVPGFNDEYSYSDTFAKELTHISKLLYGENYQSRDRIFNPTGFLPAIDYSLRLLKYASYEKERVQERMQNCVIKGLASTVGINKKNLYPNDIQSALIKIEEFQKLYPQYNELSERFAKHLRIKNE